jgi:ribosomal protein S18 acetylase RimI-like enzyme
MNYLPEQLFTNPVWSALHCCHQHFSIAYGQACRYPGQVSPFAAVAEPSPAAMRDLRTLLEDGEAVWVLGDNLPTVAELTCDTLLPCLQMALPGEVPLPPEADKGTALSCTNAPEMVALTDVAFPGFFRARTCEMGAYYGVRGNGGGLIAMAGERLQIDGHPEISGVCTHPHFRGQGLAASLMCQLIRQHRRDGLQPWLHVGAPNTNAIALYRRMGFIPVRQVIAHHLRAQ